MTYSKTEAAYLILKSVKKPLHVKEIINIAVSKNMIKTSGKTPESTLAVDLLLENRRRTERDIEHRFVKLGVGTWGLREWFIKTSQDYTKK